MACCTPYSVVNENGCITVKDENGKITAQGKISHISPSMDCSSVLVYFEGLSVPTRFYKECLEGGDSLSNEEFVGLFNPCESYDQDPEYEKVSISHFDLCLNGQIIKFEACKNEIGETVYTGSDGSTFTSYAAIFAAGYAAECKEKVYMCESKNHVLPEGETITYQDLLILFNTNGQFDDGTQGAEGISFVQVNNPIPDGATITYNGTTFTSGGIFAYGNSDSNNPIQTDFSVTSVCGSTLISYTVYKCL